MLRLADGSAVGAQAFCADLLIGDSIAVWCEDDDVWHRRILVYPVTPYLWYTVSPDGDCMVEDISCRDPEGCCRAFRIGRDGARPSVKKGSFYQHRDDFDGNGLRSLIREARKELRSLSEPLMDPRECLVDGEVKPFDTAIRRRGPLRSAPPALAGPPGDGPAAICDGLLMVLTRRCWSSTPPMAATGWSRRRPTSARLCSWGASTSGWTSGMRWFALKAVGPGPRRSRLTGSSIS